MTSCRVCICAKHLKMSQGGLWEGPCQSFGHISREASAPAWAPWLAMPAAHGQCPSVGGLAQCQSLCPHHSRFLPLGPDTRHGVSKHTRTSRPGTLWSPWPATALPYCHSAPSQMPRAYWSQPYPFQLPGLCLCCDLFLEYLVHPPGNSFLPCLSRRAWESL